ncbi:MAG TPA: hypothetical protein VGY30_06300, partial [Solirubrobacteraceae bacterium]|nr:hypothetical protein [Solirubrobacteraceae bacterium]
MKGSITMGGGLVRARVCVPALPLLAASLLAGCGGGGSSTSTPAVPVSPAAAPTRSASVSSAGAVALVSGIPIPTASYQHWLAVETALGAAGSPSHQALGFLITSE